MDDTPNTVGSQPVCAPGAPPRPVPCRRPRDTLSFVRRLPYDRPGARLSREGRAALRAGDAARASELLDRALAESPSGDVIEGLARASYFELDFPRAVDARERAYAAHRSRGDQGGAVRPTDRDAAETRPASVTRSVSFVHPPRRVRLFNVVAPCRRAVISIGGDGSDTHPQKRPITRRAGCVIVTPESRCRRRSGAVSCFRSRFGGRRRESRRRCRRSVRGESRPMSRAGRAGG